MRLSGPLLAISVALLAFATEAQPSPQDHSRPVDENSWLALAQARHLQEARELLLWDSVREQTDPAAIREYLKAYPNGTYAGVARLRLEALQHARGADQVAAAPAAGGLAPAAAGLSGSGVKVARPLAPPDAGSGESAYSSVPPPSAAALSALAPLFTLPSGDSVDDYDKAFAALRAEDYEVAEGRLRSFVESHRGDTLVPNALFWLGEIYMIRGEYRQAVAAFSESLRAKPAGSKVDEAILKLGMAQGRDGQVSQACTTWSQLRRDARTSGAQFKATLVAERRRFGC